jgi:5-formyltetrahydrofolate cyclo-ligase
MVVPSPIPCSNTDKPALRGAMRKARRDYARALHPTTRAALENAIADAVAPLFACSSIVAGFAPMPDEASPVPALARATAAGLVAAFPFFSDRDSAMTFRAGQPVDLGPWGILQPPPSSPIVVPTLILTPLIAVDGRGNRIGMGKGHYDRAVAGPRAAGAKLIGIGWEWQRLADPITPDAWDIALDGFASPAGLEMFG